jgi:adenosylcobinamide kinase/adenosylcobinamide-phosphate guanylyltransferase
MRRMMMTSKPGVLPNLTLVLGGARSGKSRHGEMLVEQAPGPWRYVATAQAFDDEMRARIAAHRAARPVGWTTVEAPVDLAGALAAPGPVLVDCLTLWLTNLVLGEHDVETETAGLVRALEARDGVTVLVSSEVGLGIVPDNALARRFRDAAGVLHQGLAARAGAVVLMVAGLPMRVK